MGEKQKYCGYRPICSLSKIPKEVLEHGEKDSDDIMTIDYLEGPQHIVKNTAESLILCAHYEEDRLRKTGRKYKRYEKEDDIEYSYGDKKYVRMKIQEPPLMRTKERGKTVGDYVFVQVEPYKWYVDETLKIAIAKDILLSDIPFKLMTSNNFGTDFLIPKEEAKVYQKK